MNKTNLQKGIALDREITVYKSTLETEEKRVEILSESFDEKYDVDVKVRSSEDTWILGSADLLPIYRSRVVDAKEKIEALEFQFKQL